MSHRGIENKFRTALFSQILRSSPIFHSPIKIKSHPIGYTGEQMTTTNLIELNVKIFSNSNAKKNPIKDLLHDIRSPLQALQALTSKHTLTKEREEEIFNKCLKRIQALVKTNEQSTSIQIHEYCIVNILKELKDQKSLELGLNINFSVKLSNPWIETSLSSFDLINILSNLINNSVKSGSNESLTIKVSRNINQQLMISVIDNGNGIDQLKIKNIGNYGTTYTKGGQGIGLASAISTLESHGAQLICRSIPNSITQFTIILPR